MKKFIILLLVIISAIAAYSQTIYLKTTAYTIRHYNYTYSRWNSWSDWQSSDMLVTFDLDNDIVKIYSPKTQIYAIYSAGEPYYDSDGDFNMEFKFIDQDYDSGTMCLLQRQSGASEIYIRFANMQWCYRVRRL